MYINLMKVITYHSHLKALIPRISVIDEVPEFKMSTIHGTILCSCNFLAIL